MQPNQTNQTNKTRRKNIIFCSWNIRRGLVIREQELKSIINSNGVDIIFLVETDTNFINNEMTTKFLDLKLLSKTRKMSLYPLE